MLKGGIIKSKSWKRIHFENSSCQMYKIKKESVFKAISRRLVSVKSAVCYITNNYYEKFIVFDEFE